MDEGAVLAPQNTILMTLFATLVKLNLFTIKLSHTTLRSTPTPAPYTATHFQDPIDNAVFSPVPRSVAVMGG